MAINKVIYGTTVLVDLTSDTVVSSKMYKGTVAHDKSGTEIIGTAEVTVNKQTETLIMPVGLVTIS